MTHATEEQLAIRTDEVRQSPSDAGSVVMIVRRPAVDLREVLGSAELNIAEGIAGDSWNQRSSKRTDDGSPHPDMQLNLINSRVSAILAEDPDQRALAGDQLHVDLDLSYDNLPPGTQLALGTAVIMVTDQPHTGCAKFTQRFGLDAHRWVNSPVGKELNLRGINARVVVPGVVSAGDTITKIA
jgi:hypothetical protein